MRPVLFLVPATCWSACFIGYQLHDIATAGPSFVMVALTLFDVVLTWLAWREWQHHKEPGVFDVAATPPGSVDSLHGAADAEGE